MSLSSSTLGTVNSSPVTKTERVEAGRVEPDYTPTEVSATYFIPSTTWSTETVTWFEERVRRRGGSYAEALIDTYRLAVDGVFGKIMADYRALLGRLADQDAARKRLIKKLIKAGIELPNRREDLTAEELLTLLDDFQAEEEAKLKKENALGTGFLIGAGFLKTLVAWPFFSNILEGTGYNGLLPAVGGLFGAAAAATVTSGAIVQWYRSLTNLFPSRSALASVKGVNGGAKAVPITEEGKFLLEIRGSLRRFQQTHPVVNGVLFVALTVFLSYIWMQWRAVDYFTLVNKMAISADVAGAMASTLVTLLMGAGLVGAIMKDNVATGRRRIDEVKVILRQWMADEISALYEAEVDRDTFNAICTRKDWAAQRIIRIGLMVIWKDFTREDVADEIRNEIISVQEDASRTRPLQIA